MMKQRIALILMLVAVPALARADTAMDRLQDFFGGLDTLSADFEQVVVGPRGDVKERARGQVYLNLPGQFRWNYTAPYRQIIVADGDRVWVYDVLLQQVTVRDQQRRQRHSPLMILANPETLDEYFEVQALGDRGGYRWLRLYPKKDKARFEYMEVALGEEGLRKLVFTDRFGRETRIILSDVVRNPDLDGDLFDFNPPPEAAVIGLSDRR